MLQLLEVQPKSVLKAFLGQWAFPCYLVALLSRRPCGGGGVLAWSSAMEKLRCFGCLMPERPLNHQQSPFVCHGAALC